MPKNLKLFLGWTKYYGHHVYCVFKYVRTGLFSYILANTLVTMWLIRFTNFNQLPFWNSYCLSHQCQLILYLGRGIATCRRSKDKNFGSNIVPCGMSAFAVNILMKTSVYKYHPGIVFCTLGIY